MTFQIKHNKTHNFNRNLARLILVGFFVLVLVLSNIFGPGNTIWTDLFYPFIKTGDYFYKNINKIGGFFSDKSELIEKNNKLMDEIENYQLDLMDYEVLKNENSRLREELKIKPPGEFIYTSVVSRPPQIPLDTLLLNVGIADSVKIGDLVLVSNKILIGKITKVSNHKSTIALNSFAEAVFYGFIARTSESLEVKGIGGGNMEAKVPLNFDVMPGDKVMISDSEKFLAAIVGAVTEDKSLGSKSVLMYLPVNTPHLNTVFVKPNDNE